nr:hypothetical protein [Paramyrothecium sp.]
MASIQLVFVFLAFVYTSLVQGAGTNSTFFNPVLPGWHSDPSCIRVDDTFFCTTSTFIAFPGLPVYASKDLVNWRLISHAWSRDSQLPGVSWNTTLQQDGMWAPTIRYRNNEFFVICEYILNGATLENLGPGSLGVLFRTTDPFSDDAWSDPLIFHPTKIDPDIFWDDDGKVYVATQGIVLQELDLVTGDLSDPVKLWNGTGGTWPEGPHIYKRDGWYYLMLAEGGTGMNHAVTIARAETITGPFTSNPANPILTNRGTQEYFQRVGHGDLFDDTNGNWWAIVHASRNGPENRNLPMGRESVMAPARWDEGQWPVIDPVRGEVEVWPLPEESRDVPGDGHFNGDPDDYIFESSSTMPKHFLYWRVPRYENFRFTNDGLEITPSRANLTASPRNKDVNITGQRGISFVGRRQTQTIFHFSVDVSIDATRVGQEAGVTVFLAQENHIELSIAYLKPCSEEAGLFLRFNAFGRNHPAPRTIRLPKDWADAKSVRLHIDTPDPATFTLSASLRDGPRLQVGSAPSQLVSRLDSGSSGTFIGVLIGVFATCNGAGEGLDCPSGGVGKFQNWTYDPIAQFVDKDRAIPVVPRWT